MDGKNSAPIQLSPTRAQSIPSQILTPTLSNDIITSDAKYLPMDASPTKAQTVANDISISDAKYPSMNASPTNTPTIANDILISDAKYLSMNVSPTTLTHTSQTNTESIASYILTHASQAQSYSYLSFKAGPIAMSHPMSPSKPTPDPLPTHRIYHQQQVFDMVIN